MTKRLVIVNADDFGQSHGVNRGIAIAHEQGIVTSASLMVRHRAASEAADYARTHPTLGVGLHLDLGEWVFKDGEWTALYQVADPSDSRVVAEEFHRQLAMFFELMDREPTHIDSHQHKHLEEPVRSVVCELADRHKFAVRGITVPYCGQFYGQDANGTSYPDWVGVPALIRILGSLTADVTEIACHPAAQNDLVTMYGAERVTELATLCDQRLRKHLADLGIGLRSFAHLSFLASNTEDP